MRALRPVLLVLALLVAAAIAAPGTLAAPATPTTGSLNSSTVPTPAASTSAVSTSAGASGASTPPAPVSSTTTGTPGHAPGPACTSDANAQYPVICLPRGFGENRTAPLSPGDVTGFAAQLVDNGAPEPDAMFTITVPAGLRVASEDSDVLRIDDWYAINAEPDFTSLNCATKRAGDGSSTVTCHTGAIKRGTNALIVFPVEVGLDAKPGTEATFTATLEPLAPATFLSTQVAGTIRVLPPSHLVVSLNPSRLSVPVGDRGSITASVHNAGAGAAPEVFFFAVSAAGRVRHSSHFVITNGLVLSGDGGNQGGDSGSGSASAPALSSASAPPVITGVAVREAVVSAGGSRMRRLVEQRLAAHRKGPSLSLWILRTIAPGATRTVSVHLRAESVGVDRFGVGALAENDTSCLTGPPRSCRTFAMAKLIAIPAAGGGGRLANSGAPQVGPEVSVGLLALLIGAGILVLVRRPKRAPHRR